MAGVVPKNRNAGRKQWTLHDGPRGSLRRLRNQLASDGCPESQVVLAKQLFDEECELEIDKKDNARLGVYWLVKASEQGNSEATELLNKCLITGRGITEHNYLDVKSCINMTQDEKIARKAAREMFASLSNGEDFITSEQLQKRMLEILNETTHQSDKILPDPSDVDHPPRNQLENGELANNIDHSDTDSNEDTTMDWSTRNDTKNEKLTEDHLVTAAVNYSHGYLPLVNRVLSLTEPDLNALDHIPVFQRSLRHPVLVVQILYFKLIYFLGGRNFNRWVPFNRADFQLFLLLGYCLFSAENITLFLPMVFFYGSFLAMVILTFQMLSSYRNFQDFRVWSALFLTYSGGSLNSEQAEFQYIRNNLKPYGHFFIALLTNLIVYPLIAEQWIPQSEITVVSFCLTFMTLLTFMVKERGRRYPDLLILFSFALNVLAKYPYETDPVVRQGWRFLDLKIPTFASYIIGNGIEFCLNFRLAFYIIIPVIFVYIAARHNWRGCYKFLIPHCVTLSWLQIVVINSQGATFFGLLRGTLALVGVVLFLPLVGLTTILLPALAIAKWFVQTNFIYAFLAFSLITFLGMGISYLLSKTWANQYVGWFQLVLGLVAMYLLLNSTWETKNLISYKAKVPERQMSWEQYQNVCHQPAWDATNIAATQLKCFKLNQIPVSWNGYINEIKLVSVKNNLKSLFDTFPTLLQSYFYCYYGEPSDFSCQNDESCLLINDFLKSTQTCNLDHLNIYEFELSIRMQSGIWGKSAEVLLQIDNDFTNFTMQLKPNDKIWFNGVLVNDLTRGNDGILGGLKPRVSLEEIGCLACHNLNLSSFKPTRNNGITVKKVMQMLYTGIKFVLNILFNPIVVFK